MNNFQCVLIRFGIGVAQTDAAWMCADSRDYGFADPFSFYIFDLRKKRKQSLPFVFS